EANVPNANNRECVCHATLPWLISFSLGAKHSLPSTMIKRITACSCGQLSATVTKAPIRVSICHCTDCQRRTGGVFATQARFPKDAVQIAGSSTQYIRVDDEGRKKATFHFCRHCSAIVYWQLEAEQEIDSHPCGCVRRPGISDTYGLSLGRGQTRL